MKIRSRLLLVLSIPEIIITWIINRTLDYALKYLRKKGAFKKSLNFLKGFKRLFGIFNQGFVHLSISLYIGDEETLKSYLTKPYFHEIILTVLRRHDRMHKKGILKKETCPSCRIIEKNKQYIEDLKKDKVSSSSYKRLRHTKKQH